MRASQAILFAAASSVAIASTNSTLQSICTSENVMNAIPVDLDAGLTFDTLSATANVVTNYSVVDADFQPNADFNFCNVSFTYSHTGRNDTVVLTYWLPAPSDFSNRYLSTGGGGYAINSGDTGLAMGVPYGAVTGITSGGLGASDDLLTTGNFMITNGTINWPVVYDFAYSAHHELAIIGQAFTKTFFDMGSDKLYSYYQGCSEGGREGWSQVQRFGDQFDGAIIGAPAIRLPFQQVQHLYAGVVEQTENYYPPDCVFEIIVNKTIEACDPLDGLTDGVVARTDLCEMQFNISSLVGTAYSCEAQADAFEHGPASPAVSGTLNEMDILVTQKILDGLHNSKGKRAYFTYQVSAYLTDAATSYNATSDTYYQAPSDLGGGWVTQALQETTLQNLVTLEGITYDVLVEYMRTGLQKYYDSLLTTWPDLTAMHKAGGKIIHFHGESDYSIPTASSVHYYESVRQIMHPHLDAQAGSAALGDWYRLYLVPGAGHCAPEVLQPNGPFPQTNLAVMIQWVEEGVVPTTLNATHLAGVDVGANEQICAWPKRPLWTNGTMGCVFDQEGYETFIYELDAFEMPIY